jgi:hypothetical protein
VLVRLAPKSVPASSLPETRLDLRAYLQVHRLPVASTRSSRSLRSASRFVKGTAFSCVKQRELAPRSASKTPPASLQVPLYVRAQRRALLPLRLGAQDPCPVAGSVQVGRVLDIYMISS